MAYEGQFEWKDGDDGDSAFQTAQGHYLDWAKSYDQLTSITGWTGPSKVADVTAGCFTPEQRDCVRILDVGAGTGLVAKELSKRGFRHIDALDPSEAMLSEAKKVGVYENYIIDFLSSDSPTSIPDSWSDSYDALTGSGIFADGHVPFEALHKMIRLVKPGTLFRTLLHKVARCYMLRNGCFLFFFGLWKHCKIHTSNFAFQTNIEPICKIQWRLTIHIPIKLENITYKYE
ncbi:uncharacterized protein LOC123545539 [Mercenaria mercenaria]|uniref:uncharacterized protein LOC123545539 n=1 Tax=Mercenaria mercenaria TaxID=6596 RepID=UPI00234F4DC9|nr:uncharacterized protein LOC123545539 [Mercenaria mercenaria]